MLTPELQSKKSAFGTDGKFGGPLTDPGGRGEPLELPCPASTLAVQPASSSVIAAASTVGTADLPRITKDTLHRTHRMRAGARDVSL
jgi:hypothetical protein